MSVKILSLVWEGFPGSGSELLTMLALADWSDDSGRCWPSVPSIARKVRLSPDQARRVVHRLIKNDFLAVTAGKNGGRNSRRYLINLDRLTPSAGATPCADARGGTNARPPLVPMQAHPLHSYASRRACADA
ncbi:MAG: helix-turn-helix domain-containing protein [Proteobacteria bacterium]|nr:helix-turn-helix domain-containing protein [Pseudomonadota bacterium]